MTELIDPEELPFTVDEIFEAARTFYPEDAARQLADVLAACGPEIVEARTKRRGGWRAAGIPEADRMPLHAWGYPDELLPALASLSPDLARRVSELREYLGLDRLPPTVKRDSTRAVDDDALRRDHADFVAELMRVCPEAVDGLAISGPLPPDLSLRERVYLLKSLPDNAGVDRFLEAWYAHAPKSARSETPPG